MRKEQAKEYERNGWKHYIMDVENGLLIHYYKKGEEGILRLPEHLLTNGEYVYYMDNDCFPVSVHIMGE